MPAARAWNRDVSCRDGRRAFDGIMVFFTGKGWDPEHTDPVATCDTDDQALRLAEALEPRTGGGNLRDRLADLSRKVDDLELDADELSLTASSLRDHGEALRAELPSWPQSETSSLP